MPKSKKISKLGRQKYILLLGRFSKERHTLCAHLRTTFDLFSDPAVLLYRAELLGGVVGTQLGPETRKCKVQIYFLFPVEIFVYDTHAHRSPPPAT